MNYYNEIKREIINNETTKIVKNYSINRSDLTMRYNMILKGLRDHPDPELMRIYDVGTLADESREIGFYIITDHARSVKYDSITSSKSLKEIIAAISRELASLHRRNIVICGVYPENIMQTSGDGEYHLVDYANSLQIDDGSSSVRVCANFDEAFLPSEITSKAHASDEPLEVNSSLDIYMLGITILKVIGTKTADAREYDSEIEKLKNSDNGFIFDCRKLKDFAGLNASLLDEDISVAVNQMCHRDKRQRKLPASKLARFFSSGSETEIMHFVPSIADDDIYCGSKELKLTGHAYNELSSMSRGTNYFICAENGIQKLGYCDNSTLNICEFSGFISVREPDGKKYHRLLQNSTGEDSILIVSREKEGCSARTEAYTVRANDNRLYTLHCVSCDSEEDARKLHSGTILNHTLERGAFIGFSGYRTVNIAVNYRNTVTGGIRSTFAYLPFD